jgi:hypothetical protein
MYNLSEKQRNIIAGIVLVLILSALSWWNRTDRGDKPGAISSDEQNFIVTDDGIVTDLRASQQVLGEVVKLEDIKREVNSDLGTDRQIEIPEISDSALRITKVNTAQGIAIYANSVEAIVDDYRIKSSGFIDELYSDEITNEEIDRALKDIGDAIRNLYAISVPRDAVEFHKAAINMFVANENLVEEAKRYKANPTEEIWTSVYYQYGVANEVYKVMEKNFLALKQKYGLR